MKVSASFLSCKDIYDGISLLDETTCDYIHVDFIKGKFVKGKEIPFRKLKKISKFTSKRLDVHLMTDKLDKYIPKFSTLNCEYITFHIEATSNTEKYIDLIHSYGIKCGIAINPDTDIKEVEPYLDKIDLVLIMSVYPGYGGQEFIEDVVVKTKTLNEIIKKDKLTLILSIDGGINNNTIISVKDYVDMVVAGSYITSSDDFQKRVDILK